MCESVGKKKEVKQWKGIAQTLYHNKAQCNVICPMHNRNNQASQQVQSHG